MILKYQKYVYFLIFFTIASILMTNSIKTKMDEYYIQQYTEQTKHEIAVLAKKTIKQVNVEQLKCMANNIYHEAGGEPFMGQVAVARVVMNRIKHGFASNPCKVIYQATMVPDLENVDGVKKVCQFSWVCEGKTTPSVNNPVYKQAEHIALKVLSENKWHDTIPGNILFFHNKTVEPQWPHKKFMEIGNHIFYGKNNKNNQ